MTAPTTHYQVLGVAPADTAETIKTAYRKLIRKHHPDLIGLAGVEMTGKINHAFSVLSDTSARRAYDRELGDAARAQEPRPRAYTPPPRASKPQPRTHATAPPAAPPPRVHPADKPWHDFAYMPGNAADDARAAAPNEPAPIFREWSTRKFIAMALLTPLGLFIAFAGWQTLLAYTASTPGGGGIVLAQWAAVPAAISALFAKRPRTWVWVLLGYAGVIQPLASLDWFPLPFLAMGQESNFGQLGMLAIALGFVLYRVAGRELVIRFRCRPRRG